jgi:hypothetical protein
MKTNIRAKLIVMTLLVLSMIISCTKDFPSLNTPKDLITEDLVSVDMLFTQVIASEVAHGSDGMGTIGNFSGMSVSGANLPFVDGPDGGAWSSLYSNTGRNLSSIIYICKKKDETGLANKIAIARIMKAYVFARTTDVYGDIPYSEACLPLEKAIYKPKYDKQKDIYTDLFKELKEAAAQLDGDKGSFGNADLMYGGDVDKWKKLANSLRLRLAMRIRYVDTDMAQANMSDLDESDLITERSDDASIYTTDDFPDNMNAAWVDLVERGKIVQKRQPGKPFLDILHKNNDPRTKVFIDTAKADWPGRPGYEGIEYFGYRGMPLLGDCPPQQKNPYGGETISRWSDLLYVQKIERPMFKCSETYFLLAEAALVGLKGSPGDAQAYYKKGMELALANAKEFYEDCVQQLPSVFRLFRPEETPEEIAQELAFHQLTQAEIDDFLDTAAVVTLKGTDEEKLEQIINQKMVALFPNEEEGFAEYIRTGYPRILIGDDNQALKGKIPRRMGYPTNEETINGVNYKEAVDALGGVNTRKAKVWWDANPNPVHPHPETVEWMEHGWIE